MDSPTSQLPSPNSASEKVVNVPNALSTARFVIAILVCWWIEQQWFLAALIAFIIAVVICFLFLLAGFPPVTEFLKGVHTPEAIISAVTSFSFLTRFDAIAKGR